MSRTEFEAFMKTLVPMKGHGDKKNINSNYRKILDKGFRCSRKEHCYINGEYRIYPKTIRPYYMIWVEMEA